MADYAAQLILELVCAIPKISKISVCLSGGNTPRALYQKLAAPSYASQIPWKNIHWFWGDERYVPKDHPASNYHMVADAMLAHVPVPATNIHRMKTELATPEATALDYEQILQREYGSKTLEKNRLIFQITFLGLGTDGHTASLFPGTQALQEHSRWVTSIKGVKDEPRITLTFPILDSSKHVIFLVTGEDKREILRRFLNRDPALPAVHIKPAGRLYVIADKAAYP